MTDNGSGCYANKGGAKTEDESLVHVKDDGYQESRKPDSLWYNECTKFWLVVQNKLKAENNYQNKYNKIYSQNPLKMFSKGEAGQ